MGAGIKANKLKKKRSRKGFEKIASVLPEHVAQYRNVRTASVAREFMKAARDVEEIARRYKKCRTEQTVGRVAEVLHARSFNADAIRKGHSAVRARTTASMRLPNAAADILVQKRGKIVRSAQVKYHRNAARNLIAASKAKYVGQDRIFPTEDVQSIKSLGRLSARRIKALRPEKAALRLDAARKAKAKLQHGTISGEEVSRATAKKVTINPKLLRLRALRTELQGAAVNGATSGAVVGAISSAFEGALEFQDGKTKPRDAVRDIAKKTAIQAVRGGSSSTAGVLIKTGLKKAGFKALAKGSAPAYLADFVLDVGTDALKAVKGDLNLSEFGENAGKKAAKSATAWVCAEAGAKIGLLAGGPVGGVAGLLVGGLVGNLAGSSVVDLWDSIW